jgi:hypothetical protein
VVKKVARIRKAAPPRTIRSSASLIAIAYKYSLADMVALSHLSQRLSADIFAECPFTLLFGSFGF